MRYAMFYYDDGTPPYKHEMYDGWYDRPNGALRSVARKRRRENLAVVIADDGQVLFNNFGAKTDSGNPQWSDDKRKLYECGFVFRSIEGHGVIK